MKLLAGFLILVLCLLQYKLWLAEGKVQELWVLEERIDSLLVTNNKLSVRNAQLDAQVNNLKQGLEVVEEKARQDLGFIGRDETFFQYLEK